MPTHVAFIMDGNGRWAAARGLSRHVGHRHGATAATKTVRAARKLGIRYVTLFAFSSENFFRPEQEVTFLMRLFEKFFKRYSTQILEKGTRFRAIGDLSALPTTLRTLIEELQDNTKTFDRFHLTVALNYGSRNEIAHAIDRIVQATPVTSDTISWEYIKQYLYTADLPDPDLIIRTSGEQRLSNFLLLQAAYAELYFTKTLWPDFGEQELLLAITDYQQRERRMGQI